MVDIITAPEFEAPDFHRLTSLASSLIEYQTRIGVEGMSQDIAVGLETLVPGILNGVSMHAFTTLPSRTKQTVALEAINWQKVAAIASAVFSIITIILKLLDWLLGILKGMRKSPEEKRMQQVLRELTHARVVAAMKAQALAKELEETRDVRTIRAQFCKGKPFDVVYEQICKLLEEDLVDYPDAKQIAINAEKVIRDVQRSPDADLYYAMLRELARNPMASIPGVLLLTVPAKREDALNPLYTATATLVRYICQTARYVNDIARQTIAANDRELIGLINSMLNGMARAGSELTDKYAPHTGVFQVTPQIDIVQVPTDRGMSFVRKIPTAYTVEPMAKMISVQERFDALRDVRFGLHDDRGPTQHTLPLHGYAPAFGRILSRDGMLQMDTLQVGIASRQLTDLIQVAKEAMENTRNVQDRIRASAYATKDLPIKTGANHQETTLMMTPSQAISAGLSFIQSGLSQTTKAMAILMSANNAIDQFFALLTTAAHLDDK